HTATSTPPTAPAPGSGSGSGSILRQPIAVWAIAFACAVSFMGIGLVDPILPAISRELDASPSQTMLLFTSYLFITGIAMFFTGWVSSRLGTRRTLLVGLALIVVFACLAGLSGNVTEIIGFRAGWGLGNALFISTALAAIVGAASGGSGQAIILYEAALGVGMAVGPLLGGALGSVSWRGPFFGTAALMFIGCVAIFVLLREPARGHRSGRSGTTASAADAGAAAGTAAHTERISALAGFRALRNPALRTLALTAVFYNFAFFTLLAYSPYPLEAAAAQAGGSFGAHELGLVFFGWGLALAVTSVLVAPVLTRRLGLRPVLFSMLGLLTLGMAGMALASTSVAILTTLIIVCGLFLGILNTALTQTVMEATDLPRTVASSTYSGVRFIGGAIAPAVAGGIADALGAGAPYWVAVASLVVSIGVLIAGGRHLSGVGTSAHESAVEEAQAITLGDE
ncbi:MAG: MFS transporter, partial [Mycetocola sp.]